MFEVTKTYGNERGISCAFRQKGAKSHCRHLHGYALGFRFTVRAKSLDSNNWVYDFGAFKSIEAYIRENFDHTIVVAKDDPIIPTLRELVDLDAIDMVVFDKVGCEAFAEHLFTVFAPQVAENTSNRAWLAKVEVFEHGSNMAGYEA